MLFSAANCPDPGPVENGYKYPTGGPYHHGQEVLFICNSGYKLEGDPTIICTDGQFNKPVASCVQENSGMPVIHSCLQFSFFSWLKKCMLQTSDYHVKVALQVIVLMLDHSPMDTGLQLQDHISVNRKSNTSVMLDMNCMGTPPFSAQMGSSTNLSLLVSNWMQVGYVYFTETVKTCHHFIVWSKYCVKTIFWILFCAYMLVCSCVVFLCKVIALVCSKIYLCWKMSTFLGMIYGSLVDSRKDLFVFHKRLSWHFASWEWKQVCWRSIPSWGGNCNCLSWWIQTGGWLSNSMHWWAVQQTCSILCSSYRWSFHSVLDFLHSFKQFFVKHFWLRSRLMSRESMQWRAIQG